MGLPTVTIEGRVGSDPELRFVQSGAAVANFSVACTERKKNQETNQWEDGQTDWYRISVWRDQAEYVTESVHRGDLVSVTGTLKQREYEQNGVTRQAFEVTADVVALPLRFNSATANRTQRQQGQQQGGQQQGGQQGWWGPQGGQQQPQGQQQGGQQRPPQGQQRGTPAEDPWATPAPYDHPPF